MNGESLEPLDDQVIAARLAGAGAMRAEVEAVLKSVPDGAPPDDYRRAILDVNAARKVSRTARMWAWKRLKLRYALDSPASAEFAAFRRAMRETSPAARGLACALMLARTDRLFRETTLAVLGPLLPRRDAHVDPADVARDVEQRMRDAGLEWSEESRKSIAAHILSSWHETGLTSGVRDKLVVRPQPGPSTTLFATELARLAGLTDSQAMDSAWFRLLGADRAEADRLLREAARAGALKYRSQAEVVEIAIPEDALA